jgi:hypothetical protein
MNKLVFVLGACCANSVFNSVQRSILCPSQNDGTKCLISNGLNSLTSVLCCLSVIYVLFIRKY